MDSHTYRLYGRYARTPTGVGWTSDRIITVCCTTIQQGQRMDLDSQTEPSIHRNNAKGFGKTSGVGKRRGGGGLVSSKVSNQMPLFISD